MQGFFELRRAHDLRDKLQRDLDRLRATPLDADAAFNFFVTAEHLLDWVYLGRAGQARRTIERRNSVLLQVCSHLANGAKHFEVEAAHHTSVDDTTQYFTPALIGAWRHRPISPFTRRHLLVRLSGDAAVLFGPAITVLDLARRVMDYWDGHARIA